MLSQDWDAPPTLKKPRVFWFRVLLSSEAMMTTIYTAAVTLLALLLYLVIGLNVGEARIKYKVRAPSVPATSSRAAPTASR